MSLKAPKRLKVGALFAGYGGIELALRALLPTEVEWVCEWEDDPSRILEFHWPGVKNYRDVTQVDWSAVPPVDVITGGSPCQDLSNAGARKGMKDGTRSGLWVSMREAIAVLRPKLVIWENVRGALSAEASSDMESCPGCVGDGSGDAVLRALGRVLGDLDSLGYDCRWYGLRAADVGAPHGRFRLFVFAVPRELGGVGGLLGHDLRLPAADTVRSGLSAGPAGGGSSGEGTRGVPERPGDEPAPDTGRVSGQPRRVAGPGEAESGRARGVAGGRDGEGQRPAADAAGERPVVPQPGVSGAPADHGHDQRTPVRVGRPERADGRGRGDEAVPDTDGDGRCGGHRGEPTDGREVGDEPLSDPVSGGASRLRRGRSGRFIAADADDDGRAHGAGGSPSEGEGAGAAATAADSRGRRGRKARDGGGAAGPAADTARGDGRDAEPADSHADVPGARDDEQPGERAGGREPAGARPGEALGHDQSGREAEAPAPRIQWGRFEPAVRRWEAILGREAPLPTRRGVKGNPELNPLFVEWMMGLPEGWVTDPAIWQGMTNAKGKVLEGQALETAARNAQLKALGNGVHPWQCASALAAFLADSGFLERLMDEENELMEANA